MSPRVSWQPRNSIPCHSVCRKKGDGRKGDGGKGVNGRKGVRRKGVRKEWHCRWLLGMTGAGVERGRAGKLLAGRIVLAFGASLHRSAADFPCRGSPPWL